MSPSSSLFVCIHFPILIACISAVAVAASPSLKVGFYRQTCPSAEDIVRDVVSKSIIRNPGLGAGLIRMHFHDCFVRGCDASILLDPTPGNPTEKEHFVNKPSLRGYEVVDEAKAELEAQCPQTVSCADIIAFAARDSAFYLGGISYDVLSGRRDGLVSLHDEPLQNLPAPFLPFEILQQFFDRKNLSLVDMVALSGAHSIGVSHCSVITPRLYQFNNTNTSDPTMDPEFSTMLKSKCPNTSDNVSTVFQDFTTPDKLDNKYFRNILNKRVLFTSDEALTSRRKSAKMVENFGRKGQVWAKNFAEAMVRMGSIEVLTGCQGEIRTNCRAVN